jgi:hypothetical protein
LKVASIPKSQRFIKEGDSKHKNKITIILKGHALIRIPQDNVRISMKVGEYFNTLKDMASNILMDYNIEKRDVVKIKEEMKAKEV